MEEMRVGVMMMSGVDDGMLLTFDHEEDSPDGGAWTLTIGRKEDNDVCLRNDTYSSRYHAKLHWREDGWWLEDCDSKNGTFIEDTLDDTRVTGTIPLSDGQLFRVGRTWMRIQAAE
jgi:pSer/pThr/pTyr-binding forkhead associated (FHA) protein